MKKLIALIFALTLLCAAASADVFEGSTVSYRTTSITAEAGGILETLDLTVGQTVTAGDTVGATAVTRVYATQDGIVARINGEPGDDISDTVIELSPITRYTVYCTVSKAYDSPATQWITCGETLYVKCTKNGTHRGIGSVYSIDGETYMVEMTAGALYVGETVYLYRDAALTETSRVGIGTVVSAAVEEYDIKGTLLQLRVKEGDYVERGQLLMTYAADTKTALTSEVSGVVTSVKASKGDNVSSGAAVAEVTAWDDILLKLTLEEDTAAKLYVGSPVTYIVACDREELPRTGTVMSISHIAGESGFEVLIRPDAIETYIGMTVEVTIE